MFRMQNAVNCQDAMDDVGELGQKAKFRSDQRMSAFLNSGHLSFHECTP